MDESDKVYIEDRALIGWQMLPEHVKTDILTMLEPLAGTPPEQWPARIRPWRPKEQLYMMPTWLRADEMYVFLRPENHRIHIEGLHLREKIELLRGEKVTEAKCTLSSGQ
jgi:hypothetical protein